MNEDIFESVLTHAQRTTLKLALQSARATIAKRRAERMVSVAATLGEVLDDGDLAASPDAERTETGLAETERALLQRIEDALRRIDRDDFGRDVETGEAIGFGRLSAIPWATRAVYREEQHERAA